MSEEQSITPYDAQRGMLKKSERWMAGVTGAIFGGAGGAAVFVSDNQAGSVALLLLAAVLLLMGYQGTALTRFGSGEHTVDFERRQLGMELRQYAAVADDPNDAVVYAEVAEIVAPSATGNLLVDGLRFEAMFLEAVDRLGYSYRRPSGGFSAHHMDALVDVNGIGIAVELRMGRRPLGHNEVKKSATRLLSYASVDNSPALLVVDRVVNADVVPRVLDALALDEAPGERFGIVVWSGPEDDEALRAMLLQVARGAQD